MLLDELAGRLQAKGVRSSPVAYLRGLIASAAAGSFVPELAPRIARVRVDITYEPTPTQRLHEALTKEFILMQKRFNGARKTIIAFKLGEFAMVLQLLTSDSKVDVALKVKKQIGTPAVGPG